MPRIEVWTVNLGRGATVATYTASVKHVLEEASAEHAAICFQEIDEADSPNEHAILAHHASEDYASAGWETAVPIMVSRKRFRIDERKVTFGSPGLPGVTPHRVVTEAVTTLRERVTGKPREDFPQVVFLNSHMPLDRPSTKTRRLALRTALTARVRFHVRRHRVVVYALDSNTRGVWDSLVGGERQIIHDGPGGIDRASIVTPRNVVVKITGRKRVDLHIDSHDAYGVVLELFLRDSA